MRHLERLGDQMIVSIPSDEDGLTGRECPNPDCLGYFKIKLGTGLKGEDLPCHCPYCGHTASPDQFWTQDQIEYAKSVALNQISRALQQDFREMDRKLRRASRGSFIQLRMEYKGRPHPIHYYQEKQLETKVTCDVCTLEYAIYGVFAYCPDCRTHNSIQILNKNLELAEKQVSLASGEDGDFSAYLIADALENAVSAFDGFGRELCAVHAASASNPGRARNVSFQNLARADQCLQELFDISLSGGVDANEWGFVSRCFQKRHLFAHKMGVVDQAYIDASGDTQAVVGRKVSIAPDEVTAFIAHLKQLGSYLFAGLTS
jgi:Zn ribbon nucleic-acid-binding protein